VNLVRSTASQPAGADCPDSGGRRCGPILRFGAYVLNASAGLNEPPVVSSAVNTKELGSAVPALEQGGNLNPHRISEAGQCVR
jgi:hypothetical protein